MPRKASLLSVDKERKVVKKIPASDCGTGVLCKTRSGKEYCISQNPEKHKHTLWCIVDGGFEKIATAYIPYDLYHLVVWYK